MTADYISLENAKIKLGLKTTSPLFTSKKYKPFLKNSEKNKKNALFAFK